MIIIYNLPGLIALVCGLALSGAIVSIFSYLSPFVKGLAFTLPLTMIGYGVEVFGTRAHIYYVPLYLIGAMATFFVMYESYGQIGVILFGISLAVAYAPANVLNEARSWNKKQKALQSYLALMPGNGDIREHYLHESLFINRWLRGSHAMSEHNRAVVGYFLDDRELTLSQPEMQTLETFRARMDTGEPLRLGWKLNHVAELQKRLGNLREQRGIGRFAMG